MGIHYSRSEQHYLNEFSNPKKETKQDVISVCLIAKLDEHGKVVLVPEERLRGPYYTSPNNCCDIMQEIKSTLKEKQKVLVVDIYLIYIQNNLNVTLIPEIENLVDKPANIATHPTGEPINEDEEQRIRIKLTLPAEWHGPVPEKHRAMFELPDSDVLLLEYAGMEDAIFSINQTTVPMEEGEPSPQNDNHQDNEHTEFFPKTHPLAVFCTNNEQQLNYKKSVDFVEVKNKSGFNVSKKLASRVRRFFANSVFGRLCYTRFEDVHLVWNLSEQDQQCIYERFKRQLDSKRPEDAPRVFFQLQVDYILVSPGRPEFKHKNTLLGF